MINFNLHLSGPRIRALKLVANGHFQYSRAMSGLECEGLVAFGRTREVDGLSFTTATITRRGQLALQLVEHDILLYLATPEDDYQKMPPPQTRRRGKTRVQ